MDLWLEILLVTLGVYYLTCALVYSEGLGGVFYRLRKKKWLPLECFICTAFWVALVVCWLVFGRDELLLYTLATAGGAVLLDKIN